ncbi:hypothetical protein HDA40_000691 [Hamadaea flava]|uniref:Uncharacterized protein n=1 Tax=Hamadaea flava TaxID=1742688 RepID=A0ABV8LZE5_9ACTN|nr:hypothetical protein [Hamadaea flava]MCP2322184.1 hypothetical protein [Hamadaea flava]
MWRIVIFFMDTSGRDHNEVISIIGLIIDEREGLSRLAAPPKSVAGQGNRMERSTDDAATDAVPYRRAARRWPTLPRLDDAAAGGS